MGSDDFLPYLMFSGGLALLIWLLLRRGWKTTRRNRKQQEKGHLVRHPRQEDTTWTMSGGPPELNRWQVEMLERTRELQATVDTKLLILQRALLKAQQAASHLSPEERTQLASVLEDSQALVEQGSPKFQSVSELLCDEATRSQVYHLHDQGRSSQQIAQELSLDPYAVEMVLNLRT